MMVLGGLRQIPRMPGKTVQRTGECVGENT